MTNEKIQQTPEEQRIHKIVNLENSFRNGSGWFYWIGLLSLLNSAIFLILNGSFSFIFGLGVTQVIDALAYFVVQEVGSRSTPLVYGVAFVIDLAIAVLFLIIGKFARKEKNWVYIAGMVLYFFDGLLVLFFADYLGAAFHLFALFGLYSGYKAMKELDKLSRTSTDQVTT